MTTLLHLDSSANHCGESVTRQLTARFAQAWQARQGTACYRYRDLAAEPVPPVTTAFCQLGRRVERHGLVALDKVAALAENPAEEHQWALTLPLIKEVRAAGLIVVGAPMYNLSVSALLKSWIDRITFPCGFADPDTGDSVLSEAQVVIVAARGGAYGEGMPGEGRDFQLPYLRAYFRKQGVPETGIHVVAADLTIATVLPAMASRRPQAERSLADARAAVSDLATRLTAPGRPA
ncbi:MAG TPA: NAD(P)H-dependent oxidoreductase [Trebonia sp.]|nr:NAD(P)H-dependent oxidoreductase [Trebonia sp.]